VPSIGRQRAEELIDRPVDPVLARQELQRTAGDDHAAIGGDHVHMVRLDGRLVVHLGDRHAGGAGEDLGQGAGVCGQEVLDQHEGHARVGGQRLEQLGERFQPARGRAHADQGERRHFFPVVALGRVGVDGWRGAGVRIGACFEHVALPAAGAVPLLALIMRDLAANAYAHRAGGAGRSVGGERLGYALGAKPRCQGKRAGGEAQAEA
jgi:hypothetical protein